MRIRLSKVPQIETTETPFPTDRECAGASGKSAGLRTLRQAVCGELGVGPGMLYGRRRKADGVYSSHRRTSHRHPVAASRISFRPEHAANRCRIHAVKLAEVRARPASFTSRPQTRVATDAPAWMGDWRYELPGQRLVSFASSANCPEPHSRSILRGRLHRSEPLIGRVPGGYRVFASQ
jgi:hypothetical protein